MNTHGYLNTRGYTHSGYPRGYGGGHRYPIYPTRREHVSYYPYLWVSIDIPN